LCVYLGIIELLGDDKLLMTDFLSRSVIRSDDSLDCSLSSPHTLGVVSDDQNVLLVFIIWLWCSALLLRALASDEDFTA